MHFYFEININKIIDLSINFRLNYWFQDSYNKKK